MFECHFDDRRCQLLHSLLYNLLLSATKQLSECVFFCTSSTLHKFDRIFQQRGRQFFNLGCLATNLSQHQSIFKYRVVSASVRLLSHTYCVTCDAMRQIPHSRTENRPLPRTKFVKENYISWRISALCRFIIEYLMLTGRDSFQLGKTDMLMSKSACFVLNLME